MCESNSSPEWKFQVILLVFFFFLETNIAAFHLTEISHSFLQSRILGTFPLYLQKIANLFSVWMTSNKIKLYCTVPGHTRELEFVYYRFLCFSLSYQIAHYFLQDRLFEIYRVGCKCVLFTIPHISPFPPFPNI